jgi:hypothetical protein
LKTILYLFIKRTTLRISSNCTIIVFLSSTSLLYTKKSQACPSPSPLNPGEIRVTENLLHQNTLLQTGVEVQHLKHQKVEGFSSLPSSLVYECGDYLTPFETAQLAFLNRASRLVQKQLGKDQWHLV